MINLAKAVLAVMGEVENIEKGMTVGSGNNTYKGVSDKDVKLKIGRAMQKHGLCLLPISVDETTQIDRWEETNQFGTKQKQSVFTKVSTKYLLLHVSGESQELAGYGQGVDPQDKAAGKATTYALKYTLLYTFLVPTGDIDDADKHHSDSIPMPAKAVLLPVSDVEAVALINAASTIADLQTAWSALSKAEQNLPTVLAAKDKRKTELTK